MQQVISREISCIVLSHDYLVVVHWVGTASKGVPAHATVYMLDTAVTQEPGKED